MFSLSKPSHFRPLFHSLPIEHIGLQRLLNEQHGKSTKAEEIFGFNVGKHFGGDLPTTVE
jgi:hypothetical protein